MNKIFCKKYVYKTIIKWITKEGKKPLHCQENKARLNIEVLEMDELYTNIKKKLYKHKFGQLQIGTKYALLHLKQAKEREGLPTEIAVTETLFNK